MRQGEKDILLVAIEGRCGAGKTTLAARLQAGMDCSVIHMDHFFLRPEQRTRERLEEPGGNVDYERVEKEVMYPLSQGRPFSYRPYDCRQQRLSEAVTVDPAAVVIVEGTYSCHPVLWNYYDLRLFLDVEPGEQIRRIRKRNGIRQSRVFRDRWIPLEEIYFAAYRLPERCDFCLPG
ncbi:MAG: uridine kinase [Eubacterium sp.]|nr:uridine kinase [Eubacterium sp.]